AADAGGVRFRVVGFRGFNAGAGFDRVGQFFPVHSVEDDRVARVGVTLDFADLRGRPGDAGPPFGRVLVVPQRLVVVGDLRGARPGVLEAALRQDALVDAGVGVVDLLLHQRAARAARADRE